MPAAMVGAKAGVGMAAIEATTTKETRPSATMEAQKENLLDEENDRIKEHVESY